MNTESPAAPRTETIMADELNARLRASSVDSDCLAAALLILVEDRGIGRVARSCGLSNASFRRQFRGARGLPLSTLMRVLQSLGLRLKVEGAAGLSAAAEA